MDANKLQKKLVRRLSTPAEWVYLVASYWPLICLLLGLGGLIAYAQVTSEDPLYKARATLLITGQDPILDTRKRRGFRNGAYVEQQVGILRSDQVLLGAVKKLGYADILAAEEAPIDPDRLGVVQRTYRKIVDRAKNFLGKPRVPKGGSLEEQQEQEALELFRERIGVEFHEGAGGQVRLSVLGRDRGSLVKQLNVWIKYYQKFVVSLSDTRDVFLEHRRERYNLKIRSTEAAMRAFEEESPEVSQVMRQIQWRRVTRQQAQIDQLKTPLIPGYPLMHGFGTPEISAPKALIGGGSDPVLLEMKKQFEMLRSELISLKVRNGPHAFVVKDKMNDMKRLYEQIRDYRAEGHGSFGLIDSEGTDLDFELALEEGEFPDDFDTLDETPPVTTPDSPQPSTKLKPNSIDNKEEIAAAEEELQRMIAKLLVIDTKLGKLLGLRKNYRDAVEKLEELESLSEMNKDLQAREQMIQIRVIDAPRAGVSAANQGSDNVARSVALGGGFGLGLGLAIAFFSEFFCRRVRFKSDVVNDAELEVVGVIPEK